MSSPQNAFPFRAEDLPPGVRLATSVHKSGIQGRGKDINAARHLGNNRWSRFTEDAPADRSQHKNEHWVVYGLPFYAVEDGEVIGAWRNAPENPAPGQTHPARQGEEKFILGGGNHLWVRHDDGVVTLYAHAQPGTIPRALCPYEEVLTPQRVKRKTGDPDVNPQAFVPPGIDPTVPSGSTVMINGVPTVVRRPRVRRGQKLGLVGNSGASGNPHLHIHQERGGTPVTMVFERGLAAQLEREGNDNVADINSWESFAGKALPNREILIWPPRSLVAEYTRFGFNPANFSRLFDHLDDSGYRPVWFDGYRVAGDVFYNFVWRPAEVRWNMFRDRTADEFQQIWNQALEDDFSPVHVESYLGEEGSARYAIVTVEDSEKDVIGRHGVTLDEHRAVMDTARDRGLSPIAVSVVSVEGNLQYTVLYRPKNIGEWDIHSRIPEGEFQQKFDEMRGRGMLPHYAAAYRHEGAFFYSVIFASLEANKGHLTRHDIGPVQLQRTWEEQLREGRLTRAVTGYDGAVQDHLFVGIWK